MNRIMNRVLEKQIQKAVIDYLNIKKIFHWRNNSGAYKAQHGSFIRFGTPGSPDIFCLKDGKIYGLEVKNEKGRQSELQKSFQRDFTSNGGLYFLIRSVDDVIELF